jgi:hypothetical protein
MKTIKVIIILTFNALQKWYITYLKLTLNLTMPPL